MDDPSLRIGIRGIVTFFFGPDRQSDQPHHLPQPVWSWLQTGRAKPLKNRVLRVPGWPMVTQVIRQRDVVHEDMYCWWRESNSKSDAFAVQHSHRGPAHRDKPHGIE